MYLRSLLLNAHFYYSVVSRAMAACQIRLCLNGFTLQMGGSEGGGGVCLHSRAEAVIGRPVEEFTGLVSISLAALLMAQGYCHLHHLSFSVKLSSFQCRLGTNYKRCRKTDKKRSSQQHYLQGSSS